MPRLVVKTGKYKGRSFDVERSAILGRGDTADVRFPDNKASREHCRVFQQGGAWVVADLNSRNGIMVNGVKTTRRNLKHGDEIEVGSTIIAFESGGAKAAPATTPAAASKPAPRPAPSGGGGKAAAKRRQDKQAAFAAARADAKQAKTGRTSRSEGDGIEVSDRVLQFSKADSGGILSFDLGQYSAMTQILIALVSVGVLVGGFWLVMKLIAE